MTGIAGTGNKSGVWDRTGLKVGWRESPCASRRNAATRSEVEKPGRREAIIYLHHQFALMSLNDFGRSPEPCP